jgi:hypothetical protein
MAATTDSAPLIRMIIFCGVMSVACSCLVVAVGWTTAYGQLDELAYVAVDLSSASAAGRLAVRRIARRLTLWEKLRFAFGARVFVLALSFVGVWALSLYLSTRQFTSSICKSDGLCIT